VGTNWHFTKDGLFTYYEANCEGGRSGMGKYEIKNDSVYFNFMPFPETEHSKIAFTKSADNTNSAWEIRTTLRDISSAETLPFVVVKLSDTLGTNLTSVQTDLEGYAKLKLANYNGKIIVTALYPGYDKAETVLEQPGNYQLSIDLTGKGYPVHIENEQRKYKLIKNEKEEIVFQTEYGQTSEKKVPYKIELHRTTNNTTGISRKEIENISVINAPPKPQMPEGYFNNANEYGDGEEFYFEKNNVFTYMWNCSDCGKKGGKGIYSLDKDTLYLRFMPTCKIENLWMLNGRAEQYGKINDSIFYLCAIQTEDSTSFLTIELCDSTGKNIRFINKDKSGFYSFGVKTTEANSLYLHLWTPDHNEEWLQLSTLIAPTQITMMKGEFSIHPGIVYKYKVIFIGKNKFELISGQKDYTNGAHQKFYRGSIH
jgi:hypothetical protein